MSKKFSLTDADFAARICRFTSADAIPLTYKIGDTAYRGIPAEFNPTVTTEANPKSDKIRRTVVTGTSPEGLTVRVEYEEYEDYPVVEWLAFFTNNSGHDTPALSEVRYEATFLNRPNGGGKPVLTHSNAEDERDTCYNEFTDRLNHAVELESVDGFSCLHAHPYMRILCGGANDNRTAEDLTVSVAIGWPGTWKTTFTPVSGGASFAAEFPRLHVVLHPGEVIRTMRMTYVTSFGGETKARNLWRRWYFDYILPRDNGQKLRPMMSMSNACKNGIHAECEGTTEENQIDSINACAARGIVPDIWWIDAGWYACDVWKQVGTWEPDKRRYPNGLGPVGECCDRYGTKFLVWFEPERVFEFSELDTKMPERVTKILNAEGGDYFNRCFYLGDKDNLDWMTDKIDAIIKEGHIKIYRQDCNMRQSSVYCLGQYLKKIEGGDENRVGAPENFHVQGYLAFWDALVERNPGLLIDSCAGGGKRNDLETMRRSFPLHYSDVGIGHVPLKQRQYRLLHSWTPYFKGFCGSSEDENGVYYWKGGTPHPVDSFSYHSSIAPAISAPLSCYAGDDELAFAKKHLGIWRRAAELIIDGDYYPLTECDCDAAQWFANEFYDDEKGEGFIQFVRNVKSEDDTFTVRAFAEDGATYTLTDPESGESFTKTAAELESGLTVTLPPRTGVIYFMKKE